MTQTKDFYKRFGIKIDEQDVRRNFIARIDVELDSVSTFFGTPNFIEWISKELGVRFDKTFIETLYDGSRRVIKSFALSRLHHHTDEFERCLLLLELLYDYAKTELDKEINQKVITYINGVVDKALEKSEIDLGLRWHDGTFSPSTAKVLDEELVEDVLDWLNDYPEEKIDFNKATIALIEKRYGDAIANCATCLEGITRKALKSRKALHDNKDELLKFAGLSGQWGAILSNYIEYANDYGKHASKKRHNVDLNEAEAFLYMTGLMIRLAINKVRDNKP